MRNHNLTSSASVRSKLQHPVIDGDGHIVEFPPLVLDYLREVAGAATLERYLKSLPAATLNFDGGPERLVDRLGWYGVSKQLRAEHRLTRGSFWRFPTAKTLDRATVMLPNLFRERLDDLGIDFSLAYSSMGIVFLRNPDDEVRRAGCRALNTMYAELYAPHAARMTVPAVIPTNTPEEALDELEYAVGKLGLKAIVIGGFVRRPIAAVARQAPELASYATWMDVLALSSAYDYDPFWKRCVELKVAVTSHTGSMGWAARTSPDNFVYNHIGHFAAAGEAFCKALVLGGVVQRFPKLNFAFLEGGVGWACNLYNDLIEHWEKRNMDAMRENLDPARLDYALMRELFSRYGGAAFGERLGTLGNDAGGSRLPDEDPGELDDFAALQIASARDFATIFERFFFGCEGEDRMTAVAFNPAINHFGAKMQAVFSSDIGHWDVADITTILAQAHALVDEGLLSEHDFRDFTFANPIKLHATMNRDFFRGTVVESAVDAQLRPTEM